MKKLFLILAVSMFTAASTFAQTNGQHSTSTQAPAAASQQFMKWFDQGVAGSYTVTLPQKAVTSKKEVIGSYWENDTLMAFTEDQTTYTYRYNGNAQTYGSVIYKYYSDFAATNEIARVEIQVVP